MVERDDIYVDLLNYDKKVSHIWKDEMIDALHLLNRNLDRKDIERFVNEKYDEYYTPVKMQCRNIYKYEKYEVDPDDTMITIFGKQNKLLGANGTIIDNHEENPAPTIQIIRILKADRKVHKDAMLEAKGEGNKSKEEYHKTHSNGIKIVNNGIYGAQAKEGALVANIDSAQLITLQARNETTEMAWTMEKTLANNLCLEDFNEAILYIKATIRINDKLKERIDEFRHYISYFPTMDDLKFRYQEMISTSKNPREMNVDLIYKMLETLTDDEKLLFYYRNNLITFLDKNPKIMECVEKCMKYQDDIDLKEIDKLSRKDPIFRELFLTTEKMPEPYATYVREFNSVLNVFVTNVIPTHNRVGKYDKNYRKAIVITDTDSMILTVLPVVKFFSDKYKDIVDTETDYFKLKSTMFIGSYLASVIKKACYMFGKSLNVPEDYIPIVDFKNEFFFPKMVVFPRVKKNYIAENLVQEGVLVPEEDRISYTGIKVVSGELNPIISKRIKEEIIEGLIIKNDEFSFPVLYKKVRSLQSEIKNLVLSGHKEYGKLIKFSGTLKYGADLCRRPKPRSVVIWNRLYPNNQIGNGDTVYYFKTIVKTKEDAIKYIKDKEMLEKVLIEVFNINKDYSEKDGSDFSNFGLQNISVPKTGLPEKLPDWIASIVDIDALLQEEFKQITDLLPGLNFVLSKNVEKKHNLSPLISF